MTKQQFKPGWYKSINNTDYHASSGWSSSQLKKLLTETPLKLQHPSFKASPAMGLGTAVHSLCLEPDQFDNDIYVGKFGRSKDDIAKKADIESRGITVITDSQYESAKKMAENVHNHPIAGKLLTDIYAETSIFGWYSPNDYDNHTEKSMMFKVRPDAIPKGYPIIVDLKTTKDASFTSFMKDLNNYGYDVSAAMYLELCNQCPELLEACKIAAFTHFVFIVVENTAPHYEVAIYELSVLPDSPAYNAYDIGRTKYHIAARRLSDAIENGFDSYPIEPRPVELPPWADRGHII